MQIKRTGFFQTILGLVDTRVEGDMGTVTQIVRPIFSIGQLVYHQRFNYRGVIVDVDPRFRGTEQWYEAVALSRPPKNRPWYSVLVHGGVHSTYVAERHLEADTELSPIENPGVSRFFSGLVDGRYTPITPAH